MRKNKEIKTHASITSQKAKVLGYFLGTLIQPAYHLLGTESFKKARTKNIEIYNSATEFNPPLKAKYIIRTTTSDKKQNRKIVVYFSGNTYNLSSDSIATFQYYGVDVATTTHPLGPTSAKDGIAAGVELIKNLIKDHGYSPKSIIIIGHSLGGGISAQVLDHFQSDEECKKLLNSQKFEKYINFKSFDSLSTAVVSMLFYRRKLTIDDAHKLKHSKFFKIAKRLISNVLYYVGWEMDTIKVLVKKDLPVKEINIVTAQKDEVIGNISAITADMIGKSINNINYYEDQKTLTKGGHNFYDSVIEFLSDIHKNGYQPRLIKK